MRKGVTTPFPLDGHYELAALYGERNAARGYAEYSAAVYAAARFGVSNWSTDTNAEVVTVLRLRRQT